MSEEMPFPQIEQILTNRNSKNKF